MLLADVSEMCCLRSSILDLFFGLKLIKGTYRELNASVDSLIILCSMLAWLYFWFQKLLTCLRAPIDYHCAADGIAIKVLAVLSETVDSYFFMVFFIITILLCVLVKNRLFIVSFVTHPVQHVTRLLSSMTATYRSLATFVSSIVEKLKKKFL